ncbi:lipocalin-like domain-containing protein [Lacisediminimonas profundi]|uniref:lipocalin-like domain-containing protein n=1 Tax=Lacisediminimonas profundi TaxID=2603856 RepID=UPI001F4F580D|nr:carotenoid 1,2-hydratase [Lacisediminimonas profundi]
MNTIRMNTSKALAAVLVLGLNLWPGLPGPLAGALAAPVEFAAVTPGKPLQFPADFGAHPDFRTEWWYATGWLKLPDGTPIGFQVTFFRSRTEHAPENPSKFAPKQLIIAHAAISDPRTGKLLHDQKSGREGWGLAYARTGNTDVRVDDWSFVRQDDGQYQALIKGREFSFALKLAPTQSVMLQGEQGYSRKGPQTAQASYYYSKPQLRVTGTLTRAGQAVSVSGDAWLDHEWSSTVLDERAAGWDWVGANLDDGSALMMFRIRGKNEGKSGDKNGGKNRPKGAGKNGPKDGEQIWAHAVLRDAAGRVTRFDPGQVSFTPLRNWRSPRTGASYPVSAVFRTGDTEWRLNPLQDDQELDSRASTGSVYWEGAVTIEKNGKPAGHGYLELTGYEKAMKL